MLDLIASFAVRGLNAVFHLMPIGFNLWFGRRIGILLYFIGAKRRRIAYANIKAAFCEEKTPGWIKRVTKGAYRNMAQIFMEILSFSKVDKAYIDKYVEVVDIRHIENASQNPKGMILVSAHFGDWELSTVTSAMKGFPLYMLARDQKMERLNELLNKLRELKGNNVIRKGADVKNIFRVLRDGKGVGLLADQNAGPNGELIDLFGRPASTAVGPYRLAQKIGSWVLPAFIHRKKGAYHRLVVEEPMIINKDDDITHYMERYNKLLEKHIRLSPDQWLWMHKKWKRTPVKKIMVLDDGKQGHLKQSLSIVDYIKKYRRDEGYVDENTKIDVVSVRFRDKKTKLIFNAASLFFSSRCQGCLRCLRYALDKESYESLVSKYADVVISCGSSLFGVNRIMKIENNAKNLTVMDPGKMRRKAFDLIVIPRHDVSEREKDDKKIIVTELAPNLIESRGLSRFDDMPRAQRGDLKLKKCVGLLFGGENPAFTFGEDLTKTVACQIRTVCKKIKACFYVTTSRRTSRTAEKILRENLENDVSAIGFISGREDKDKNTVEKILAASDVVVVSGESISMVSEAISAGKPVLVFMPDKKTDLFTKYEKFLKSLTDKGYVVLSGVSELADNIERMVNRTADLKVPEDGQLIYDKIHKLF
ncbi:MAG: ELM1/GtrOC1 family putative glycosyltransferase [Candidatus Omnitrophota bacterium]